MTNLPNQGLYLINSQESLTRTDFLDTTESLLRQGVAIFQYRNKHHSTTYHSMALSLQSLCSDYQIPFCINDDIELAKSINADGVHLGGDDISISVARDFLGNQFFIGASCYNQFALAEQASKTGADYIAFGACFASATKPTAVHAPLSLFKQAKSLNIPCVGIGGITLDNTPKLISAGAKIIAVISDIYANEDPVHQVQAYITIMDKLLSTPQVIT